MVPLESCDVLSLRKREYKNIIRDSFAQSEPQSKALTYRLLGQNKLTEIGIVPELTVTLEKIIYGGYPEISSLGFLLVTNPEINNEKTFFEGLIRLKNRSEQGLYFFSDDIALLGLAEGVANLKSINQPDKIDDVRKWLLDIILSHSSKPIWTFPMRNLAARILGYEDGFLISNTNGFKDDIDYISLKIVLLDLWNFQRPYKDSFADSELKEIFVKLLMSDPAPRDLEKAAIRLRAIDILIRQTSESIYPKTDRETLAIIELERIKNTISQIAQKNIRRLLILVFTTWILITCFVIVFRSFDDLVKQLGYVSIFSILVPVAYYILEKKDFSFFNVVENLRQRSFVNLCKKVGFDLENFKRICRHE